MIALLALRTEGLSHLGTSSFETGGTVGMSKEALDGIRLVRLSIGF